MDQDLKIIKKKYGENMAHLCRTLFPTLLETDGLLSGFLTSTFNEDKFLYDNIIENNKEEEFKNYIYSLVNAEKEIKVITNKTPKELMDEAGYILYECSSEEDIQFFKKYYKEDEALCTFRGNRLDSCYVFFAVKKNVDDIKREDFTSPARQDEYGTSVISIQFSRGEINTLSIKNRYNHIVNNSDATFSNNLENIIPGLADSFSKTYDLNVFQNNSNFELPNYTLANNGKFYKYNYEYDNICYCPNNIIINSGVVEELDKSKCLLMDYFIINFDKDKKNIVLYDDNIEDYFIKCFDDIEKIDINSQKDEKEIFITFNTTEIVTIKLDKYNQIIYLDHPKMTTTKYTFLFLNRTLREINVSSLKFAGPGFLHMNEVLEKINAPSLLKADMFFLHSNEMLKEVDFPRLIVMKNYCMTENKILQKFSAKHLVSIGNNCFRENIALEVFNVQNLRSASEDCLQSHPYFNIQEIINENKKNEDCEITYVKKNTRKLPV